MENLKTFKSYKICIISALIFILISTIVTFLWNAIIPSVFHLPEINFWQAAGFMLILKLISYQLSVKHVCPKCQSFYKQPKLHEYPEIKTYTPEERASLKAKFSKICNKNLD